MSFAIEQLEVKDHEAWDEYVLRHQHGTPFHLSAWKATIEEIFPYRHRYLVARGNSRIQAVLPMFLVDTFLTGRALVSTPFAVYGGILADSQEARDALRAEVCKLADELGVQYVELRNAYPQQCVGFTPIERYVTFTMPVVAQDDETRLAAFPKKTRNLVRKALKSPFSAHQADSVDNFYHLMASNYRRLGTPIFPRAFFERLIKNFGPRVDIREIKLEGKVAVAALNFFFEGSMHTYYAASDHDTLAHSPNNFMYFEFLRWAGSQGLHTFDFGRSKRDTGTFEFKKHFGSTMRDLPYEVLLVRRTDLPNFSPMNPKFGMAIKVWQKLPLAVTNFIGPLVIHMFP